MLADFILFTFTGEAVQTFGLHYCLLAQLEDTWLQENGTQFPFLGLFSSFCKIILQRNLGHLKY